MNEKTEWEKLVESLDLISLLTPDEKEEILKLRKYLSENMEGNNK